MLKQEKESPFNAFFLHAHINILIHWYIFIDIPSESFRMYCFAILFWDHHKTCQNMGKGQQGSTCHDSWHVFVTLAQVWPAPWQSKTLLLLGQVPEKSHVGFVQKLEYIRVYHKASFFCEPELFPGKTKTQSWGGKSASGGNAIAYRNLWPV